MRKGNVYGFFGDGRGKVSLAVGYGVRAISENLQVIMIQFLETSNEKEREFIGRFEPDMKLFRFNKQNSDGLRINQKDAEIEVRQAFNFAKKVVDTAECDVLILDGIVDAVNKGLLNIDEVQEILLKKDDYMEIAIIGRKINPEFQERLQLVYEFVKNIDEG